MTKKKLNKNLLCLPTQVAIYLETVAAKFYLIKLKCLFCWAASNAFFTMPLARDTHKMFRMLFFFSSSHFDRVIVVVILISMNNSWRLQTAWVVCSVNKCNESERRSSYRCIWKINLISKNEKSNNLKWLRARYWYLTMSVSRC